MLDAEPDFTVHAGFSSRVIHVGDDREPVLVVDDLLLDPDALVRWAQAGVPFRKEERDFYPGIRKPLGIGYARAVCTALRDVFLDTFGGLVAPRSCVLSLTTTPPEQLRPIQSVPHFDSVDAAQIAGVHYLCGEAFGGTAFYRHRGTGYERMDAQRLAGYAPRLKAEVMAQQARSFTYIRGTTALFERTGSVDAKFNRAVFYRSNVLHSGDIRVEGGLLADPRTGRLTANMLGVIRAG